MYITKSGKKFGPYYYASVRTKKRVKSVYLGSSKAAAQKKERVLKNSGPRQFPVAVAALFLLSLSILLVPTQFTGNIIVPTGGGSVPTHSTPFLNATDTPFNRTSANLTVHNVSTADADNDDVKNIITWYRNSTTILTLNAPFENSSNTSQPKDYAGNDNNGSVTGATFSATAGYDGKGAYTFDGFQDWITFATPKRFDVDFNPFSMEVWVNMNPNATGARHIMGKRQFSGGDWSRLYSLDGDLRFEFSPGVNLIAAGPYNDSKWHHLVGVRNISNITMLFIDGVLNTTGTDTTNISNSGNFTMGYWNNEPLFFNGTLDEVRFYNISLTPAQVTVLYNNRTALMTTNMTAVSDNWSAEITPHDGANDGITRLSNPVIIQPDPVFVPVVTQTIINASNNDNKTSRDLLVFGNGSSGSATNRLWLRLYKNDTLNISNSFVTAPNNTLTFLTTLTAGNTSKNDNWTAQVWIDDGSANSTPANSSIIILDTAPTTSVSRINATNNDNRTSHNLEIWGQGFDLDPVDSPILWLNLFRNDTFNSTQKITSYSNNTFQQLYILQSGNTSKNDNWTSEVWVQAGSNSTTLNSSIIVLDTAPTVVISRINSTTNENFSSNNIEVWSQAFDLDPVDISSATFWFNLFRNRTTGDTFNYTAPFAFGSNNNNSLIRLHILTSSNLSVGDIWTSQIFLQASQANSTPLNSSITIRQVPGISPQMTQIIINASNNDNRTTRVVEIWGNGTTGSSNNLLWVEVYNNASGVETLNITRRQTAASNNTLTLLLSILPGNNTKNLNWTARVFIDDFTTNSTALNSSVIIANSPPTTVTSRINATTNDNQTNRDLELWGQGFDHDPDNLIIWLTLFRNSTTGDTLNLTQQLSYTNNSLVRLFTLRSGNTTKGENWTIQTFIQDNNSNSTPLNSSISIANSPPTTVTSRINATTNDNQTNRDLELWGQGFDHDNDTLTLWLNLFRNAVLNSTRSANHTNNSLARIFYLTSGNLSATDNWTSQFFVNDGTTNSTPLNSSIIIVSIPSPSSGSSSGGGGGSAATPTPTPTPTQTPTSTITLPDDEIQKEIEQIIATDPAQAKQAVEELIDKKENELVTVRTESPLVPVTSETSRAVFANPAISLKEITLSLSQPGAATLVVKKLDPEKLFRKIPVPACGEEIAATPFKIDLRGIESSAVSGSILVFEVPVSLLENDFGVPAADMSEKLEMYITRFEAGWAPYPLSFLTDPAARDTVRLQATIPSGLSVFSLRARNESESKKAKLLINVTAAAQGGKLPVGLPNIPPFFLIMAFFGLIGVSVVILKFRGGSGSYAILLIIAFTLPLVQSIPQPVITTADPCNPIPIKTDCTVQVDDLQAAGACKEGSVLYKSLVNQCTPESLVAICPAPEKPEEINQVITCLFSGSDTNICISPLGECAGTGSCSFTAAAQKDEILPVSACNSFSQIRADGEQKTILFRCPGDSEKEEPDTTS